MSIKGFIGFWSFFGAKPTAKTLGDTYKETITNGVSIDNERYTIAVSKDFLGEISEDSTEIEIGKCDSSEAHSMMITIKMNKQEFFAKNENPDIKLFRKESDIEELSKIQLEILENCSRYVKSGGRLYYSTCSVLPEENDSVVYSFLQKHKEFTLDIPERSLTHRRTKYGLQFLPHISLGAGFFVTGFIKV